MNEHVDHELKICCEKTEDYECEHYDWHNGLKHSLKFEKVASMHCRDFEWLGFGD